MWRIRHFYPRPPRGGRLAVHVHAGLRPCISIHALREEGDPEVSSIPCHINNFYPRPPRGGRRDPEAAAYYAKKFLSTPSARRATCFWTSSTTSSKFLSTPSARRATRSAHRSVCRRRNFYPRPPRGGRRGCAGTGRPSADFYPRPPRGGRLLAGIFFFEPTLISIHALREEGDSGWRPRPPWRCNFYPRPPRGGRLKELHRKLEEEQFLSTPSVRRATRGSRHVRCKEQISIHALREEGDAVRPPFFASCF